MDLFRAVPLSGFDPGKQHRRIVGSVRIPSNVPYVVDNLWEAFRPEGMPSRRHAIYASPTPELALANASAGSGEYVACKVVVDRSRINLAQLQVTDAREHVDIKAISRLVSQYANRMQDESVLDRTVIGQLFMPGAKRFSMLAATVNSQIAKDFFEASEKLSTFWRDASKIIECHPGELFFELMDDHVSYILEPV